MDIVVISPEHTVPHEVETMAGLLDMGMHRYHIRKPSWTSEAVAALLALIPSRYYSKLSIHGQKQLAVEYNLGGLHLSSHQEMDRTWDGWLSKSLHDPAEISNAVFKELDYCFLSPVFDSISKHGYRGKSMDWELPVASQHFKVYALGGVDVSNAHMIEPMGFNGMALMGAIWKEERVDGRLKVFEQLQRICRNKEYSA